MNSPTCKLIPIFTDNYIFALQSNSDSATTPVIVDPGESETLIKTLSLKPGQILKILITHRHHDHIGGLKDLCQRFDCEVWGPRLSQSQIPEIHHALVGGEKIQMGDFKFEVMALPGHTWDHLAFYEKNLNWLFCGDVLFRSGCGRLFEGDFATAYASLQKIKSLPPETQIFCTHEYTLKNMEFSLHRASLLKSSQWVNEILKQKNEVQKSRDQNLPSIPFRLEKDLSTNPFLLAQSVEEFKQLRVERDQF